MKLSKFNKDLEVNYSVIAIQYFIKSLNLAISRNKIKEMLMNSRTYPLISADDISQLLSYWNIESTTLQIRIDDLMELSQLENPFIACYRKNGSQCFIIVKEILPDKVYFYLPDIGETSETLINFKKNWTGIIIVAGSENYSIENKLEMEEESNDIEFYQKEGLKVIPNFLNFEECDMIINFVNKKNLFRRSEVINELKEESFVSEYRTSFSAVLYTEELQLFSKIKKKVAKLLKVKLAHIEDLQCVRYGVGQEFKAHYDSGVKFNRKFTILIYLNDDFDGGGTYFPELFLTITPQKGNALFFLNQTDTGETIRYSYHAGLPIINGFKYACNVWVKDCVFISKSPN
jgi:hypothetical protein